mmetsp:Transcript_19890/g.14619  ORF Transcript_19890/g.14619 Transcript_19890/m.14619 type:complete len:102 (+) Transcript_19890:844-1149(+)
MITLAIFPGLLLNTSLDLVPDSDWFVLFMITTYNIFDAIARYVAQDHFFVKMSTVGTQLIIYSRLLFIATFLLVSSSYFTSDVFKIVNVGLFGFTNGIATC